jgi:uncharacterized iron-regulated membrane protein
MFCYFRLIKKLTKDDLQKWNIIHRWSSLIATPFLLILFLTGIPLIFSDEIEQLTHIEEWVQSGQVNSDKKISSLQEAIEETKKSFPLKTPLYIFFDKDDKNISYLKLDDSTNTDENDAILFKIDLNKGEIQDEIERGFSLMHFLFRLHVDLYSGLYGKWFLGFMTFFGIISILSGIVVFLPYKKKAFQLIKNNKSNIYTYITRHNIASVWMIGWALIISLTGLINAFADPLLRSSHDKQIENILSDSKFDNAKFNLDDAIRLVQEVNPGMNIQKLAYPETLLSGKNFFTFYLHGKSHLEMYLTKMVYVDLEGQLVDKNLNTSRPWYIKILQLSKPLHFGDFGGIFLKIIWFIFDAFFLYIIYTGVVILLLRRKC